MSYRDVTYEASGVCQMIFTWIRYLTLKVIVSYDRLTLNLHIGGRIKVWWVEAQTNFILGEEARGCSPKTFEYRGS